MRSLRPFHLLLLLVVCCAPRLVGQQSTKYGYIDGQIFLSERQPASYIQVRLDGNATGQNLTVITDPDGKFQFPGLVAGKMYTLMVELHGYQPVRKSVDLTMSRAFESITLQPDPYDRVREVPPEGAGAVLDARVAMIPPEASSEFQAGRKRLDANDSPGAVAHFQKAIDLFSNYAEAYQLMGGAYLAAGNLPLAEAAFVKAVTIEDRLANAQLALGLTRNLMGNTPAAEKPLERAVQLDPNNPDAHFELAKNKFALHRYSEAEAHAEKSLELKPQNPPVYVVLGYTLLRQKKPAEAEEAFRHFLKMAPSSPMAPDVKQALAMIEQHEQQTRHPR